MRRVLLVIIAMGASATARAQPIATDPPVPSPPPPNCTDRHHARNVFERMTMIGGDANRIFLRDASCTASSCRIQFGVRFDGEPGCTGRALPPFPPDSPLQLDQQEFECHVPLEDCIAIDEEGRGITAKPLNEAVYARCIQPAIAALEAAGSQCTERPEPIGLPPAPRPRPNGRVMMDLGAGWIAGDQVDPIALALGFGFEMGRAATLGGRLGYLAAGGTATTTNIHAIDAAVRVRLGRERRQVFTGLEGSLGYRLTLSGDDDHLAAGVGLLLGWRGWTTVLRYERALEASHTRDAVYVITERGGPRTIENPRGDAYAKRPRVGLGLALIGAGWGFKTGLGPIVGGAALELPVYLGWPVLPYFRWDVIAFPGLDDDLLISQAALVGWQWYQLGELPFGVSGAAGYALAHGDRPRVFESGMVADVGAFYWLHPLGVHLGINARFGLDEDNRDLRAVFASIAARQIFSH